MARTLRALVVVFPGSNGDRDLFEAFTWGGFAAEFHPSTEPLPEHCDVVGLPGGFSYGDYWRAGMLASQAKAVQSIAPVIKNGGLAIGICNGFQILVEAGYLPGALTYNQPTGFRHGMAAVRAQKAVTSPWFSTIPPGEILRLPFAHGEGNYFHPEGQQALIGRVPLTYVQNPNGSMQDAAALLDESGQILGIMPHPERAADADLGSSDGLRLFAAAHDYLSRSR